LPPTGNVFLNRIGRNRTQDGPSSPQGREHAWKPDGFKPSIWPYEQNRQVSTEYSWNGGN
jgi:hypothetical protein